MLTPPLLYRTTRIYWMQALSMQKQDDDGDYWRIVKQDINYHTEWDDVQRLLKNTRRRNLGTMHSHYTVRVESALMPVFREYSRV